MVNVWEHLFIDGEFALREHILQGLTAQQAGVRPEGSPHSIYEELWHAATWQHIVLRRDEAAYTRWENAGQFPATHAPEDEAAWQSLVATFLEDSAHAVKLAEDEAWLNAIEDEDNPGFTWRNALEVLAVHSAYHLGKVVLLRQLLGLWEPEPENA